MKNISRYFVRALYFAGALLFSGIVTAPIAFASTSGNIWTDTSATNPAMAATVYMGSPTSWNGLASSASGKYVVQTQYNGDIYTSSNYGANWTDASTTDTATAGQIWVSAAANASGQYVTALSYGRAIWTSSDYGATWVNASDTDTATKNLTWIDVTLNSTGQRQVALARTGGIWTSSDYGASWTQAASTSGRQWWRVTSDSTGQHLAAVVQNGDIYTSSDYGASWTDVSTASPNTINLNWSDIASSSTGEHMAATVSSGDIYVSSDYGVSWADVSTGHASITGKVWGSVTSDASGQYLAAAATGGDLWTSSDYGATWTDNSTGNSNMTGQQWINIQSSANGKYLVANIARAGVWIGVNPNVSDGTSAVPNGDDANDDGMLDYTQNFLAGSVNPVTSDYAMVQAGPGCTVSDQSVLNAASQPTRDDGYVYPAGLMNFTVQGCGAAGFTTTITQYYYGVSDANFVLRKYNPATKAYATVTGATITHAVIGGQSVMKATYQVTDGGSLDEDGTANGVIVDPAGLALPSPSASTLTDTGYNANLATTFAGSLIVLAVAIRYSFRRR